MSKYVSKSYLNEKYKRLKWNIDSMLESAKNCDKIPDEEVERFKYGIIDSIEAIKTELGD